MYFTVPEHASRSFLQAALIAQELSEINPAAGSCEPDEAVRRVRLFVDSVLPWRKPGNAPPFQAKLAKLSEADLDPSSQVELMRACLVEDCWIPLMKQGLAAQPIVRALVEELRKELTESVQHCDGAAQAFATEVLGVCKGILCYMVRTPCEAGTHPSDLISFMEGTGQRGLFKTMKHVIEQSPFHKEQARAQMKVADKELRFMESIRTMSVQLDSEGSVTCLLMSFCL